MSAYSTLLEPILTANMSTYPTLVALPVKILKMIIHSIAFQDICSLRLASRDMAAKCSSGIFRSYFSKKTISIRYQSQREEFEELTADGQVESLVRYLTLHGIALAHSWAPVHGVVEEQFLTECFQRSFRNLRNNSPNACLRSLRLSLENFDPKPPKVNKSRGKLKPRYYVGLPRKRWEAARQLCRTALPALCES